MEHIMNAQIESVNLGFKGIEGKDGKNFICFMGLLLANKSQCTVDLNPLRLPEFMDLLDVRSFYDIEGKYLQVKFEDNKRPDEVKPILASEYEDWYPLDNGMYFGSRIIKEE